jgi:hypothetical protein
MESLPDSNAAEVLFEVVKTEYEDLMVDAKKNNQSVKLECDTAGGFGIVRVAAITAHKFAPLLRMQVQHEDKSQSMLLIHASRCAFMFSLIPTSAGGPVVGFVMDDKHNGKSAKGN